MTCPFCTLPTQRIIDSKEHGVAVRDAYPISPGHTLIIPRRHVGSFFEISAVERTCLFALLDKAKAVVEQEFKPDGFNIGIVELQRKVSHYLQPILSHRFLNNLA